MRPSPILALLRLPLLGLAAVALYLVVETLRPGTLSAAPFTTIPEAIAGGNPAAALEMVAEGGDIDQAVPAANLDSVPLQVTPLQAAILSRRIEAVRLLRRSGADVTPIDACLARRRLPEALPLLVGGDAAADEAAGGAAEALERCRGAGAP